MALTKTIDFLNGVVSENTYITVSNINIDFEAKSANFNVKVFLNKDAKTNKLQTMNQEYLYDTNTALYPNENITNTNAFTTHFSEGNVEDNVYNYLLTLDKYKDATIVD